MGGVTGRRVGYNVPRLLEPVGCRGAVGDWVERFSDTIFSASFKTDVVIPYSSLLVEQCASFSLRAS